MPQRHRITVTIRHDLLKGLDDMVDHHRIRNRSHALEVALSRSLDASPHQAIILASGAGTHMRPFTYEIPKPLIPVNGKPLLEHGLVLLRNFGIKDIIITVSHLAPKIMEHFGNGNQLGVNITYVPEKKLTGTGGALRAARPHLSDSPFLVLYSDVLFDLDVTEFLAAHQKNQAAVGTIALTSVADPSTYGAVRLRGNRVVQFSEKPAADQDVSRLVFAGCAAFDPTIFELLPERKTPLSLEQDVFPELIKAGQLYGYPFEGRWFDVSTPEVYERVVKEWK
jgi:NDP-sugar pyrophosphorylase family protein